MPNYNENNYLISSKFSDFLKNLPGLRITPTQSTDFINVVMSQIQRQNSFSFFSRRSSSFFCNSQYYLLDQLFRELEKNQINDNELIDIGIILKKYFQLLKYRNSNHTYYLMTPGIMAGFFIALHLSQLFFPAYQPLIYGCLMTDLYCSVFWIFSVWSFSKFEQGLCTLENKLIEKLNFLKSLSFSTPIDPCYLGSSASLLPSYNDVLLEDSLRTVETPTFDDPRSESCYSI